MAEPILLDRYRDSSYSQTQEINRKLDFVIDEMRDMRKDIRTINSRIDHVEEKLDRKIENVRTELKDDIENVRKELKGDIESTRSEFKEEVKTARWQLTGIIITQICSIGAIVWAVASVAGK